MAGAALVAAYAVWQSAGSRLPDGPVPTMVIEQAAGAVPLLRSDDSVPAGAVALALTTVGRVVPDGAGFRHQWPAVHASARFEGDQVMALFDDGLNRYRVSVDDTVLVLTRPGTAVLQITGLGFGPHDIRVEKLNESPGPARFGGFFVPPDARALTPPAPRAYSIVFVGDSDTVGYGNTARTRDCTAEQVFLATDTGQSYGARVARYLAADYRMVARSGIGLVRNYDGADPGRTLPDLYPLALDDGPLAVDAPADIVVVGIGSNDFATALRRGEAWADLADLRAAFQTALLDFLRDLRARNPDARIVLLAFGGNSLDLVAAHETALAAFRAGGGRADLVILPALGLGACHWHPTLADHALIADSLIAALGDRADLWQP